MTANTLHDLFRQRRLWKGNRGTAAAGGSGTGFASLDKVLPFGGWPRGAVIEITVSDWGIGELSLFLPLMAHYNRGHRYVTWVAPPHTPYPPALVAGNLDLNLCRVLLPPGSSKPGSSKLNGNRQILWCVEKLLQSSACGLVLAWPRTLSDRAVRRLQLAVEGSEALCILWRRSDQECSWDGSPATMRLKLTRMTEGLKLEITKVRGTCRHPRIVLDI